MNVHSNLEHLIKNHNLEKRNDWHNYDRSWCWYHPSNTTGMADMARATGTVDWAMAGMVEWGAEDNRFKLGQDGSGGRRGSTPHIEIIVPASKLENPRSELSEAIFLAFSKLPQPSTFWSGATGPHHRPCNHRITSLKKHLSWQTKQYGWGSLRKPTQTCPSISLQGLDKLLVHTP